MKTHNASWRISLAAVSVLAVIAQPIVGQESVSAWTPELSMQYHAIQCTAISPYGQYIAYVVRKPLMEGSQSEYLSHIWVATADGAGTTQYTRGEKSASNPSFSPDGQYLAFTTGRTDETQVWIIPLFGGEAQQVTEADAGVGRYQWAPDGSRIYYTMRDSETEEEKTAKEEKLDVILVDQNFKFNHVYSVSVWADESGERTTTRLTSGNYHVTSFDVSPDGATIVFAHQSDPRINTGRLSGDISTVPSDSGAMSPLVITNGVNSNPFFSPDGRSVAFRSTGNQPEPIGLGDVYVVSSGGGTPRKLAETHDRSPGIMGWTGNGSAVLVSEATGTTRGVFAVPADGGAPYAVTSGEGVIGSVSFSKDAQHMAFTFQTTDSPPDVHISAVADFSKRRITDVHGDVPRPVMGRTELLTWKSPDGLDIEGLLTYPVDYQRGRRYPLILNVHGGPAGVFSQSFTGSASIYMIQTFAQEGYAVLRPNPRGSTGYGKEFRYANFQDWGYGDLSDLMAGVDEVIDMGIGHSDSLLLMGWSYGGYMTSFAVTQTDRFKVASMGAGLPNLISMTTTTDIQDYLVGHMGVEFWDDYERYERHSAIYHIANVVSPTQVIHGAEDLRVPFTQGQEFYRALGRRGIPTEMIVYPRTPHGPREPKFLMDVTGRIMSWFNHHLGRSTPTTDDAAVLER